jgi:hypothetical protein
MLLVGAKHCSEGTFFPMWKYINKNFNWYKINYTFPSHAFLGRTV